MVDNGEYAFSFDMWCVGVLAYEMLCGVSPFFDERGEEAIYARIRDGAVTYARERFGPGQRAAKELIRKLLMLDPRKRLSATQVLQHPWITGHTGPYEPQACVEEYVARHGPGLAARQ